MTSIKCVAIRLENRGVTIKEVAGLNDKEKANWSSVACWQNNK